MRPVLKFSLAGLLALGSLPFLNVLATRFSAVKCARVSALRVDVAMGVAPCCRWVVDPIDLPGKRARASLGE